MNDDVMPSREGCARPRSGPGVGMWHWIARPAVLLAGVIATISRTAASVAEATVLAPVLQRGAGLVGVVLEILADPLQAIALAALVTTIAGAIAAWRRSVAAGVTVAAGLFALAGLFGNR